MAIQLADYQKGLLWREFSLQTIGNLSQKQVVWTVSQENTAETSIIKDISKESQCNWQDDQLGEACLINNLFSRHNFLLIHPRLKIFDLNFCEKRLWSKLIQKERKKIMLTILTLSENTKQSPNNNKWKDI